MKELYPWAVNQLKLTRAIQKANDKVKSDNAVLKAQGKELISVTDSLVKKFYVEMAGLLAEDAPEVKVEIIDGNKKVTVKRKK